MFKCPGCAAGLNWMFKTAGVWNTPGGEYPIVSNCHYHFLINYIIRLGIQQVYNMHFTSEVMFRGFMRTLGTAFFC